MRKCIIVLCASVMMSTLGAGARQTVMKGSTYRERAASLIDNMLLARPAKANDIKYHSPFYFARLLCGRDTAEAVSALDEMYQHQLDNVEAFYKSGSNMDFFAHATMHGYMLTKERMPETLRAKIKDFMKLGKYASERGTLNMRMMHQTSGLLCAEEWPDFVDADGHDAAYLKEYLTGRILAELRQFFTGNCREADAFTYIGTNLQYVRMLAEFSKNDEIRRVAEKTYQHMAAQMLLPWNQGLYCANPPRCKGWANLQTGNNNTEVQISQLAWLFYGKPDERPIRLNAAKDNFACFNFWMAYPGRVEPLEFMEDMNAAKTYPYSFDALRVDERHYSCRHTYQSKNYGLSTQTIEAFPEKLKNFQYTYAFKETKNLHLVWQSDTLAPSVFSVCFDNPERPQRHQTVSNKPGYGECPYHRVLGYEESAVGIYNVPEDYMDNPKFYQMYVPFSRKGIKTRVVRQINGLRWVLCHTGSMMFAFATPEEWDFDNMDGKYFIKDHDVLTLRDHARRRGCWVLETTEITDRYKDAEGNPESELRRFADDIQSKVNLSFSPDYETGDNPAITYTNLRGNKLELSFFSPETPYNGQYKINGNPLELNTRYISKSDYMNQKAGSTILELKTPSGLRYLSLD